MQDPPHGTNNFPPRIISDEADPLKWFDEFIHAGRPERYIREFFQDAEDLNLNKLQIDLDENSYSFVKNTYNDGFENRIWISYTNYLTGILALESRESRKLIDSKILSSESEDAIRLFIKKVLNKLNLLIGNVKSPKFYQGSKYPIIQETLSKLVYHIFEAHAAFVPDTKLPEIAEALNMIINKNISMLIPPDQPIANVESSAENNAGSISKQAIKGFSFVQDSEKFTLLLYGILISLKIIIKEETDFVKFCKAFSGDELEEPLEIKWHLENPHKSYKVPILRMIDYLTLHLHLLEKVAIKAEKARKIEHIFVDKNGTKLTGTEGSIQEMGAKPSLPEKEMLEALKILRIPGKLSPDSMPNA